MPISGADRKSVPGYTLTELLVALVILSIAMTGSVMFAVERSLEASLPRLGSQVSAMIGSAASRSVLTQSEVLVVVDPIAKEISTLGEDKIEVPDQFDVEVITAQSEVLDANKAAIRFFPEGGSTGGSIRLFDGQEGLSVEVDWLTGRVSIVEVQDGQR